MSHSFFHSEPWEAFQKAAGAATERGDGQLYVHRALPVPLGSYWLSSRMTIPDNMALPNFTKEPCFVRLEPADAESFAHLQDFAAANKLSLVTTHAVQPRQTSLVAISGSDDEMLAAMKPKHRYNLRLAQKNGLVAEAYSKNLTAHFERFWTLLTATASRQGFRTHAKEYYRQMLESLEPAGMAHLLFVRQGEEDLATLLLITYEDTATYLHGASSDAFKQLMAPYLLHWEAIRLAKEAGCATYDLWGTDAEYNEEKKEWQAKAGAGSAGTTRFKLGFGGAIVDYPGAFDLVLKPFCYTLYKNLRSLRGGKRAFS